MRDQPRADDEFADYPPEVSHEADGADWTGGYQDDWPVRRRGPRPAARWLLAGLAVVLGLAAAGGIALVKETSGGTAGAALAGDGTRPSAGAGVSARPAPGTSSVPRASTVPRASHSARTSPTRATSRAASASPAGTASPRMGIQVGAGESGPAALGGVLAAANASAEGRGLLPAAKCHQYRQNASGAIVCTAPVPGVAEVFYQNYSSLTALYAAYQAQVAVLGGGGFRQNTGTCGNSAVSYAEFAWNQEEGHPHNFTVAQMAAGRVAQVFAGGRMACFRTRTKPGVSTDIVWTIDNGRAMGVEIGDGPVTAVYDFWAALHHTVLFRGTEMCGTADRMNARDIPTGNLKIIPVCPAGVEAVPAGS